MLRLIVTSLMTVTLLFAYLPTTANATDTTIDQNPSMSKSEFKELNDLLNSEEGEEVWNGLSPAIQKAYLGAIEIVDTEYEFEDSQSIGSLASGCHTRSATVTGRTAIGTTGFVLRQSKYWCWDGWNVWNVQAPNFTVLEMAWNAQWQGTVENTNYNYTHANGETNYSIVQGHVCFTIPGWGCTQNYYPYLENWANQNGSNVWYANSDTQWGD